MSRRVRSATCATRSAKSRFCWWKIRKLSLSATDQGPTRCSRWRRPRAAARPAGLDAGQVRLAGRGDLGRQGDGGPHLARQSLQGRGVGGQEFFLHREQLAVGPLIVPAGQAIRIGPVRLLEETPGRPIILFAIRLVGIGQQHGHRVGLAVAGMEGIGIVELATGDGGDICPWASRCGGARGPNRQLGRARSLGRFRRGSGAGAAATGAVGFGSGKSSRAPGSRISSRRR